MLRFCLIAFLGVVVASAALPTTAVAGTGARPTIDDCQNDGYTSLFTTAGGAFTNAGECVSYVARGGVLVRSSLTVTPGVPEFPPDFTSGSYPVTITGTGLLPDSIVRLWISGPGASTFFNFNVGSDGTINETPWFTLACPVSDGLGGGYGWSSGYATGTTRLGEPITSGTFTAPC